MQSARHAANLIRRRLDEVSYVARRDPSLVRIVTGNNGDRIAQWFSEDGASREFNVSDAQRRLGDLVKRYGPEILKTRSGQIAHLDFKFLGLS